MPGLFNTLTTAADALGVFSQALNTVSNNVVNQGTPGYARQNFTTVAQAFDPRQGLPGGIAAGEIQSSRNEYAEQAVWRDQHGFGQADQTVSELSAIEPLFDVTGDSGIPAALNGLFQSFSALSVSPNDSVARSSVLSAANELAHQFNSAAANLTNASMSVNSEIANAVTTVNSLAHQIAKLNTQLQGDAASRADAAVDASLHNALESLAEYVDFTALRQPDGSVTVLMDGQTPLVMGDQAYAIQSTGAGQAPSIKDFQGKDVTATLGSGRLKALVDMNRTVLPGYADSLNRLAAGVSDQVNNALLNGVDQWGNAGAPLFSFNYTWDAASTIQVTGISADQVAAALPSAPGGNGNALSLAGMANAPQLDGMTFTQYYASLASKMGQALNSARQDQATQQDLLEQARTMRSDTQGVSLDVEATKMIEYQRAYQATARVVGILNDLTDTVLNMFQGV